MKWYIKSKSQGYFVGEMFGLGFFESDDLPKEQAVSFDTKEEAEEYLSSWTGGRVDCFVTHEEPAVRL